MNEVSELSRAKADRARHVAASATLEMEIIKDENTLRRKRIAKENADRLAAEALEIVRKLEAEDPAEAPPAPAPFVENGHLQPAITPAPAVEKRSLFAPREMA